MHKILTKCTRKLHFFCRQLIRFFFKELFIRFYWLNMHLGNEDSGTGAYKRDFFGCSNNNEGIYGL